MKMAMYMRLRNFEEEGRNYNLAMFHLSATTDENDN